MKKRLLLSVLACFAPFTVKAASLGVNFNCPNSAKASETITCTIEATPVDTDLKGIQSNIQITNGTYVNFGPGEGWITYFNNASGFSLGRNEAVNSSISVGNLTVKMPTSGETVINLTNVQGGNSSYATLKANSLTAKIRVQSTINTLDSLSISKGTLTPNFNTNNTEYSANVDSNEITISATATDSKAKINGVGTKNLNYGNNKFIITVTSEAGTTKNYTINITRPDNRSKDTSLKKINITNTDFKFTGAQSYTLEVENNITEVDITAETNDSKANLSGTGKKKLNVGKNTISLNVTAENGTYKTYTIIINRKAKPEEEKVLSNINYLTNLKIEGATFNFNKDTLEYEVTVPNSQDTLEVDYTKGDSKQSVKIKGGPILHPGNNSIVITVTAEDKTVRTYNFTVIRQENLIKTSNTKESIIDTINENDETIIYVTLNENEQATLMDQEILDNLKNNSKEIIFEWITTNGNVIKSIHIKGKDINDTNVSINPNIKDTITSTKLLNHIAEKEYVGINTNATNLPKSNYKIKVDEDNSYYLVFLNEEEILRRKLTVSDGYINFNVENGMEYALVIGNLNQILEDESNGFPWLFPTLLAVIAVLVFMIFAVIIYRKSKKIRKES